VEVGRAREADVTLAATAFHWGIFWHYLWPGTALHDPLIRTGLWVTIYMAVLAQALGVALGVLTALMQMSRLRGLRWAAGVYVLYFRGTPVIVQLALLYFGLSAIGLYTFPDIHVFGFRVPGIAQAGILGLGLNEGAYMAEIVRAGIISIDPGQMEAAKSIVPPLGNEFNNMLKSTTLVVTIGGVELFNAYEQANARLFAPFELFLAASFYYLFLTIVWSLIQMWIERRLGERKGIAGEPNLLRRLAFGGWRGRAAGAP
jgi:polar amino acid transport system permease protein